MRKFAVLVIALAFSSSAFAADMAVKTSAPAAAPTPAYSWTGFYVGGNFGVGWSADPTVTFTPNDPFSTTIGAGPPISFSTSGPAGGFQVGYNWQFSQAWLLGVESDFDFSSIAGNGISNTAFAGVPLQQDADERVKWFGTVRGRVGYVLTNGILLYGAGGYAYGRVTQTANYSVPSGTFGLTDGGTNTCLPRTTCYSGASATDSSGWTVGGGLELAVMDHWTAKAEYLYVSLSGDSLNEKILSAGGNASITAHFSDTNFQVVRVGLNYRF